MTSHSPIIISDIPRENLIVLEKKGVGGTDRIEQVTLKTESFLNNLLANYAVTFSVESFV